MLRTLAHRALQQPRQSLWIRGVATKAETQQVLSSINKFWFAESDKLHDEGKVSFQKWWFQPTAEIDREIKAQFGSTFARVVEEREHVDVAKETPEGTLALIVLLDQMGRNMYRGEARAFAGDEIARSLAFYMVRRKFHEQLRLVKRSFVFMPLMHAEDIEAQDLSVQMYTELAEQLDAPDEDARNSGFGKFAEMHRDVISQFGRFPSRNKALGRETTPEEAEWLKNAPF
ncbi:hypothetical protein LPJ78_004391 [Coemansia sp. RSA 989]|nr:hypothetical protein BX667DRAFT_504216 [Coemansia mojavensis]KAJ1740550.1 hypothetical protein LPJ68_003656 [Coemansia sp. RSA 1086]KAJ1749145.1 hypothetical protein LPJ79_003946 [Coemansia sp. RSA 1821]KAJ1862913.1 hypothetical protein LPJ78_004391 [Coemansia sp. RSA 989]KAJ1870857.1 hypothetical protein LPJ55_004332 [Coemansia sp. RSA 990]KAJ2628735.1 hypothetical protein H4R22_003722 [Coemansia sp. RSA 1290]KAJ2646840.1 hypothetical protein IWW40_005136 [Coemansia sp. RSA 1250]KAJ26685